MSRSHRKHLDVLDLNRGRDLEISGDMGLELRACSVVHCSCQQAISGCPPQDRRVICPYVRCQAGRCLGASSFRTLEVSAVMLSACETGSRIRDLR